jgi:ABC-2 type transport system permease protein
MPLVVIPQLLVCGLFVPRDALPPVLGALSDVLPLSYAVDAMSTLTAGGTGSVWPDLAVVLGFVALSLALGAVTLRRRTS